jgi:hypothetical protein
MALPTMATPIGPVDYVARDLDAIPRNAEPPSMFDDWLRGMTVHWPGGNEAKRYAAATTFDQLLAIDRLRVADSIRNHLLRVDANGRLTHSDVGYNYFVGRSGVVFGGREWTRNGANGSLLDTAKSTYPAGTTSSNPYWVSVQVIAGVDLPDLTAAQWESLKRLYTWICHRAGIEFPQVNGHRDVRATSCPGDVVHSKLPTVESVWPVVRPEPVPPVQEEVMRALVFRCDDGDVAQFAVAGGMAKWIKDQNEKNTLLYVKQIEGGNLIPCNRALLKSFVLVGPAPTYPPTHTGGRTVASDFGSAA